MYLPVCVSITLLPGFLPLHRYVVTRSPFSALSSVSELSFTLPYVLMMIMASWIQGTSICRKRGFVFGAGCIGYLQVNTIMRMQT